jgi:quercetin dioxygenase-like cupin family protein
MKDNLTKNIIKDQLPEIRKSAGIGLFVWDASSDYLYWDEGMFYLFEITKEDFKNSFTSFSNLLSMDDSVRILESIQEAINNKSDFVNTFKIITKAGEVKYIKAYSSFVNNLMVGVNIKISEDEYLNTLQLKDPDDYLLINNKRARLSIYSLRKAFTPASTFSNLIKTPEWTTANEFGIHQFKYRVISVTNNKHLQMEWIAMNETSDTHYHKQSKLITNLGNGTIIVWVNGEEQILKCSDSILIKAGTMHKIRFVGSCYAGITFFNFYSKEQNKNC